MSVRSVIRSFAVAGALTATTAFFPPVSPLAFPPSSLRHPPSSSAAAAALDTAIARMGGEDALRKIERVRFEMMTLWQRMAFENRPSDLIGSYELHTDLRNYALGAWRNTRRFVGGPTLREMTDVVQRDAAIRRFPANPDGTLAPWAPLSIAYVDERKELFAFAPERLLLSARTTSDLRTLADTTIAGVAHARVGATVDGYPATIFLRRNDGFLAMARYRAAQPNDFGLAPWGNMEVEVWYSRWNKFPVPATQGVGYPTQWDVRRVGRMYKRLTVLAASFDAAAPADSFAISDSLRSAFASGPASRPMWDVPMDSAKILEPRLARLGNPGQAQSAVKIGSSWLFLEGTGVPQRNASDVQWLASADAGSTVGGLLITVPNSGRGGAAWFAEKKLPVYVAPGAGAAMAVTLANWKQPPAAATVVAKARWVKMGGDSLWIETIDYPDLPGAVVAYVPSMRWAYSGIAASALNFDLLVQRIRTRGWDVERIGSLRSLTQPVPTRTAAR
jgi:hypothetical protein